MRRILPTLLALVLLVPVATAAVAADDPAADRPSWVASILTRLLDGLHVGVLLADDPDDESTDEAAATDEDVLVDDEDAGTDDGEDTAPSDGGDTEDDAAAGDVPGALDENENDDEGDEEGAEDGEGRGRIVSLVARCAPVGPGLGGFFDQLRNHGAFTRAAAHGATVTIGDTTYDLSTLDGAQGLCAALAEVELPHPSARGGAPTDDRGDEDEDADAPETGDVSDDGTAEVEELTGRRERAVATLRQIRRGRGHEDVVTGGQDGATAARDTEAGQDEAGRGRGRPVTGEPGEAGDRGAAGGGRGQGPPVRETGETSRGTGGKGGPPADRGPREGSGPRG